MPEEIGHRSETEVQGIRPDCDSSLLERSVTLNMDGMLIMYASPGQERSRWHVILSNTDTYAKIRKGTAHSNLQFSEGRRIAFDLVVEFYKDLPEPLFFAENAREWKRKRRQ